MELNEEEQGVRMWTTKKICKEIERSTMMEKRGNKIWGNRGRYM